jgi:hypothetical protein
MNVNRLYTHLWSDGANPRQLKYDGRTILHHRCLKCGRDFAQGFDGLFNWEAIHVGVLTIERLSDSVTARWLAEECPGQLVAADDGDRTERRLPRAAS